MTNLEDARRSWLDVASYRRRSQIALAALLCLLFLVLTAGSLLVPLTESLTYDEQPYFDSGVAILSGQPSASPASELNPNIMPALAIYPLVGNAVTSWLPAPLAQRIPESVKVRLPLYAAKGATIAVSLILAAGVFSWARALYGVNAGFLALTLYVLDPNIIGHSRVVHQNILEACAIFLALYAFWKLVGEPGAGQTAGSLVTFGIAQITRFTALYLVPIFIVLAIGRFSGTLWRRFRAGDVKRLSSSARMAAAYTALFALAAVVVINLGYAGDRAFTRFGDYAFKSGVLRSVQAEAGALNDLPVPLPFTYVAGIDFARTMQESSNLSGPAYLNGRLGLDEAGVKKGFADYYLVAFLYKVPIATQMLIAMAALSLVTTDGRRRFWRAEAFLVIPCLVYVAVFSFSQAQLGIRYILMIFPLLFVLASRVTVVWADSTRSRVVLATLLGYLLASNLSYYPHYLSYFNELMLDRKLAYTVLADSNLDWGQNTAYLVRFLRSNPEVMYPGLVSSQRYNWELPADRLFDPDQPMPGRVVISANDLVGITAPPERYRWIREKLKPIEHVAHSYLVFDIKRDDLPAAEQVSR